MIRFYKTATKILRTLKSYLTGAVLKIVLFSYNGILRYVQSGKKRRVKDEAIKKAMEHAIRVGLKFEPPFRVKIQRG